MRHRSAKNLPKIRIAARCILLIAGVAPALLSTPASAAEKVFTIFQTADIHSHFDNRASEKHLGGVARLKTLVDRLRSDQPNSILLDAGDWSEGTLFFALNSGYASQSIIEAMHYDAVTLGNHDWLVGPKDLSVAFAASGMKTPVLSANLNFNALPGTIPLRNYIRPYIVKVVNGVRIGIFGLSTFQLIYDSYFLPVQLEFPLTVAALNTNYLRDVEKCDVVIALSHMGIDFDRLLAKTVPGIDVITGGHTHKLFYHPENDDGVIVNHVGKWGEYVGEMQIAVPDNGKPYLKSSRLNAVNELIPEDASVARMVKGFQGEVERQFNEPMFNDTVFISQVHDHVMDFMQDEPLGNWAVDAIRESVGADVAFDHARYAQQNLLPGPVSSADIFNIWPHIYLSETQKAWTIHTFELPGAALNAMLQAFFRFGGGLKMSNVRVVVDYAANVLPLSSIAIGDKPIDNFHLYRIAAPGGIMEAFSFLDTHFDTKLGATKMVDTGVEAWRVIRDRMRKIGALTPQNGSWQGRVRSLQPDLYLPYEQLASWPSANGVGGRFEIVNVGLKPAAVGSVKVLLFLSADGGVTRTWQTFTPAQMNFKSLGPGKNAEVRFQQVVPSFSPGEHLYTRILVVKAPGELHADNNLIEALLF